MVLRWRPNGRREPRCWSLRGRGNPPLMSQRVANKPRFWRLRVKKQSRSTKQLVGVFEFTCLEISATPQLIRPLTSCPPGEARAILAKAEAKAQAVRLLSEALTEQVGRGLNNHRAERSLLSNCRLPLCCTERKSRGLVECGRAVRGCVFQSRQRVQHHPSTVQFW